MIIIPADSIGLKIVFLSLNDIAKYQYVSNI
jgi:hypothetical protein